MPVLVLVLVIVAAAALLVSQPRDPVAAEPQITSLASDPSGPDTFAPDGGPTAGEPVAPTTESPTGPGQTPSKTADQEYLPEDPPAPFPSTERVVRDSRGKACSSLDAQSDYGAYPLAQCTMWQRSAGLLHGEFLSKGPERVTCQRDLGRENPVFKAGQTNTWWVWTNSDDGTWDWYPETAVSQGVPDEPINGIARCQDAS